MKYGVLISIALAALASGGALAQERVVAASNVEALFHSPDPKLDANKQAVYHFSKDVLGGGDVAAGEKYMTERYIQHNPNIPSGRAGLLNALKPKPGQPSIAPMNIMERIVSVVAEGDMVVVAVLRELPNPKSPGKTYTTTSFDMWRLKDGRVDEHWDGAELGAMGGFPPGGPPGGAPPAGGPPGGAPPAGGPPPAR